MFFNPDSLNFKSKSFSFINLNIIIEKLDKNHYQSIGNILEDFYIINSNKMDLFKYWETYKNIHFIWAVYILSLYSINSNNKNIH